MYLVLLIILAVLTIILPKTTVQKNELEDFQAWLEKNQNKKIKTITTKRGLRRQSYETAKMKLETGNYQKSDKPLLIKEVCSYKGVIWTLLFKQRFERSLTPKQFNQYINI